MFIKKPSKLLILTVIVALILAGTVNNVARAAQPTLTVFFGSVGDVKVDKEIVDRWGTENNVTVNIVYAPQSATDTLAYIQQLLAANSTEIDRTQFDVIWPG